LQFAEAAKLQNSRGAAGKRRPPRAAHRSVRRNPVNPNWAAGANRKRIQSEPHFGGTAFIHRRPSHGAAEDGGKKQAADCGKAAQSLSAGGLPQSGPNGRAQHRSRSGASPRCAKHVPNVSGDR